MSYFLAPTHPWRNEKRHSKKIAFGILVGRHSYAISGQSQTELTHFRWQACTSVTVLAGRKIDKWIGANTQPRYTIGARQWWPELNFKVMKLDLFIWWLAAVRFRESIWGKLVAANRVMCMSYLAFRFHCKYDMLFIWIANCVFRNEV